MSFSALALTDQGCVGVEAGLVWGTPGRIPGNLVLNTFARYAIIPSKLSPALAAVNTAAAGALSCGALVFTTRGYLVLHTILL